MMATRDIVNEWLEKRRQRARAEGLAQGWAEGFAQGRAEGRAMAKAKLTAEIEAWNNRRLAAAAKGEPFDEPPPI